MNKDFWDGYVIEMQDDYITCILKRDYKLDKELTVPMGLLNDRQKEILCMGLLVRFDVVNNLLQMMLPQDYNIIEWV